MVTPPTFSADDTQHNTVITSNNLKFSTTNDNTHGEYVEVSDPTSGLKSADIAPTEHDSGDTKQSEANGVGHSYSYEPAPVLATSRYNRQMLIPSVSLPGQQRILSSRILIIGLGGLGSPAALYLAGAGVGKLGLLDSDVVETSNLHRQIVHRENSVAHGMTKVRSAARGCREVNSDGAVEIVEHEVRMDVTSPEKAEEIMSILDAYDIVLDCTDNPATRYLISDLCVLLEKTLISGAAQRLEGQMMVLNYPIPNQGRGPCYRCVFPTPPSPEMVKGCSEIGILGPVVGTIGTLMATEALRLVVKGVETRKPSMLLYSAWSADPKAMFRGIGLRAKRANCVSCGDRAAIEKEGREQITRHKLIQGDLDYVTFCGLSKEIQVLRPEQRVAAQDIVHLTQDRQRVSMESQPPPCGWRQPLLVDTREPHEVEMGAKLNGSINIPFSRIQRQSDAVGQVVTYMNRTVHDSVLFVCPRGNDSQIVAQKLIDWRNQQQGPNGLEKPASHSLLQGLFIGDVKGGFAALENPTQ